MTLKELGWNDDLETACAAFRGKGWVPARLIRETVINYGAFIKGGEEIDVVLSGKVWHDAVCDADLPAVGDWVMVELGDENQPHVIRAMLPRRTCFSRKMPGNSSQAQVIGANVDYVAVVTDAGPDFNIRRMERYFMLIGRSGAKAVVLVNKSDLFPIEQSQQAAAQIAALWDGASVHVTSAVSGQGLKVLKKFAKKGITMCIVGSSGVGKSTLVNQLYGEEWQWTSEVNEITGKGRHTTTSRELVPLPNGGGMLIDNPGMREIQMWTDEATLRDSFADVEALTGNCKFSDCSHRNDAKCAIRAAVEAGTLDPARYENFLNLENEIAALRKRSEKRQIAVERWAKRNSVKARNLADRIQLEKDDRGDL